MSEQVLAATTTEIEKWEGFSASPYQDSGGIWTIGYGSIFDDTGHQVSETTTPVTEPQARAMVTRELANAVLDLAANCHMPLTQGEQVAFLDFIFNCGRAAFNGSTMLRLVNAGKMADAIKELDKWDHVSRVVVQGLLNRRNDETRWAGTADINTASQP